MNEREREGVDKQERRIDENNIHSIYLEREMNCTKLLASVEKVTV